MAAKRKESALPPASSPSHSSSDDSSSEEEWFVEQPNPSRAKNRKLTERNNDGSEEEEEEEEEDEEEEKPKSPAKKPRSQPDRKKLKLSDPAQSRSKKSVLAFQRIWSPDDELTLLRAFSEYCVRHGKLLPRDDYASFISSIKGSIGYPFTDKQFLNKVRQMKYEYGQNKKQKDYAANTSDPHKRAVFTMCAEVFEDTSATVKKNVSLEALANRNVLTESGGTANGGGSNGGAGMRPCVYLGGLIKDLINRKQLLGSFSSVEDVVERIGGSKARDLEAKAKELRIDAITLHSLENKLMAELFAILADKMGDD